MTFPYMLNQNSNSLNEIIEDLKFVICGIETKSLIHFIHHELSLFHTQDKRSKLKSPGRQSIYLLGLMCSTYKSEKLGSLQDSDVNLITSYLNEIFTHNSKVIFQNALENGSGEERRKNEIAAQAFLHFFNQSFLASIEQVEERCLSYSEKFDHIIVNEFGFKICDGLQVIRKIKAKIDSNAMRFNESKINVMNGQEPLISSFEKLLNICIFTPDPNDEIENAFCKNMSVERDGKSAVFYFSDDNPFETKHLVKLDGSTYACPMINMLWFSFLTKIEDVIQKNSGDSHLIFRDKYLEYQCKSLFSRILPAHSQIYTSVYETPTSTFEHDIIIIVDKILLAIEAKASPPTEPFRDPVKAYTRIKRHFKSERGIQKGFEQALRIKTIIDEQRALNLYSQSGDLVASIDSSEINEVIMICITRDDFGPLATNLDYLLEKEDHVPYPWVISVLDLENLIEGFEYLEKTWDEYLSYIKGRTRLHGNVYGDDELEYAGFYLNNGGFENLFNSKSFKVLAPGMSDIFDKIYMARQTGKRIKLQKPHISTLRKKTKKK